MKIQPPTCASYHPYQEYDEFFLKMQHPHSLLYFQICLKHHKLLHHFLIVKYNHHKVVYCLAFHHSTPKTLCDFP